MARHERTPEGLGGAGGSQSGTTDCNAAVDDVSTPKPTDMDWEQFWDTYCSKYWGKWDGGWSNQQIKDNTRKRVWLFVFYPESCPKNWKQRLGDLHCPIAVSPLHYRDYNPDTGEVKKPHFHGIIYFDGKKSFKEVREMLQEVVGAARFEICWSLNGSVRYLCHLDEDEQETGKVRYAISDVTWIGPVPIAWQEYLLSDSVKTQNRVLAEMRQWCRENDVMDMKAFLDECDEPERIAWKDALRNNNTLTQMRLYVQGSYHQMQRKQHLREAELDGERDKIRSERNALNDERADVLSKIEVWEELQGTSLDTESGD